MQYINYHAEILDRLQTKNKDYNKYMKSATRVFFIYNDLLISWLWMLLIGVWAESKVIYSCTSWNDYLATAWKAFFLVRSEYFAYYWLVQPLLKTIAPKGLYHISVFRSEANFMNFANSLRQRKLKLVQIFDTVRLDISRRKLYSTGISPQQVVVTEWPPEENVGQKT